MWELFFAPDLISMGNLMETFSDFYVGRSDEHTWLDFLRPHFYNLLRFVQNCTKILLIFLNAISKNVKIGDRNKIKESI